MFSKKINIPYGINHFNELNSISGSLSSLRTQLEMLKRKAQKTKSGDIGSALSGLSSQLRSCKNEEWQFHYHAKMEQVLRDLNDEINALRSLFDAVYQAPPSYCYAIPLSQPEPVYVSPSEEVKKQGCHHDDGAILVAKYIVQEIKTNAKSRVVNDIRYFNDFEGRRHEREMLPPLQRAFAPREEPELATAMGLWTLQVRTGGPWDHKPLIRDKFRHVAIKERPYKSAKGGEIKLFSSYIHKYKNHDYFYDVWSNIHYGYIGMVCGFSKSLLLNGAGLEQIVDDLLRFKLPNNERENKNTLSDFDGVADRESVLLGIRLFKQFGMNAEKLTYQSVLDGLENIEDLGINRVIHLCFDTSETRITAD